MSKYKIVITDIETGETLNKEASEIVMHIVNSENEIESMFCCELAFTEELYKKQIAGEETVKRAMMLHLNIDDAQYKHLMSKVKNFADFVKFMNKKNA